MQEFAIEVELNFIEMVKARTKEEAVKKLEDRYIRDREELPREYISIREYNCDCAQVED